jgi:uncharacterized DUF497 family protein
MYRANTELWAGWDSEAARAWCKSHGLTKEDIKIVQRGEQVIVIAKREVSLERDRDIAEVQSQGE